MARHWARRIQILHLSSAQDGGGAAGRTLCAARRDRQSLARSHRYRDALSGLPRENSCGGATTQVGSSRHRCLCVAVSATTTVCIRIFMASTYFHCWSCSCCRARGVDFDGGDLVLTEQRPRMRSRVEVVPLTQGEGAIIPVHHRPVQGTRGAYRVNMRHGVSRLRGGRRHTLGIIFHDAN